MEQVDKEALEAQRQEILQRRAQFFADNPHLASWIRKKKLLYRFFAGYLILHSVLSIVIMVVAQFFTVSELAMEIVKCIIGLFWMFLFMNPSGYGSWRLHVMLYLSAACNFWLVLSNFAAVWDIVLALPMMQPGYMLLYGVLIAMDVLYPFLLLATATYLMAFRRHREWSEQIEAMYKSSMQTTA